MKLKNTEMLDSCTHLLFVFVFALSITVASVCEAFAAADNVRDECLRLHILANSDSEADQSIKLIVRDEVLKYTADMLSDCADSTEASSEVLSHKEEIIDIVEKTLENNGFLYGADLYIEDEFFETRQYEDIKLPAGVYKACKIILGKGEGHNWWCVMFPQLCLPVASEKNSDSDFAVFGENGTELIKQKSGYKIRFRIVEIAEEILNRIRE